MHYPELKSNKIVIMPIHLRSVLFYHSVINEGIQVLGFWDNNNALDGMSYDGTKISLPASADALDCEVTIVIYYREFEDEIRKQLIDLGHSDFINSHVLDLTDIDNHYINIIEKDFKHIAPKHDRLLYMNSTEYPLSPVTELLSVLDNKTGIKANNKARRVLLISHDLSITGAPIALQNAANAIQNNGDIPIMYSRTTGNLLSSLLIEDIPVIIDYKFIDGDLFLPLVSSCDIVIVNTITAQSLMAIEKLNGFSIPVLLWTHEGFMNLSYIPDEMIPKELGENISIYCVGEYSRYHLMSKRADISADILLYGIRDFYKEDMSLSDSRLKIMTIGTIYSRKGQDILCSAVRKLDDCMREMCEFIFIGKAMESESVYQDVLRLKSQFPNNVVVIDEVEREQLEGFLYQCDCMVCASRDDPMPIFITEAMMFHKVCICSENTGFTALIEDGVNGFIYTDNSADELCRKLEFFIQNSMNLSDMKAKSRKIYEEFFSFTAFSKKLINILNKIYSRP